MFDLTSTKLFILGVVALLVVGPQELPALLRTVGRYIGMIKRQAAEFRSQFDDAMRESELAELKKEVETLGKETQSIVQDAEQSVHTEISQINSHVTEASDAMSATPAATPSVPTEVTQAEVTPAEVTPADVKPEVAAVPALESSAPKTGA